MTPENQQEKPGAAAYADVGDMPPTLVNGLRLMITRVRRIQWIRGIVGTLAVLLFSTLTVMVVEVTALPESVAVRWGLWAAIVVLTAATAWAILVKPLIKPLSITRMARVLETRHPDLQERISTVLELKAQGGAAAASSTILVDAILREAMLDMDAVSAHQEFTFRSAKPFLVAFAAAAGIFSLCAALWTDDTLTALNRVTRPYVKAANIRGRGILVEPGNTTVLRGSPLTILVSHDEKATVRVRNPPIVRSFQGRRRVDETMRSTLLTGAVNRAGHTLTFPAVFDSFKYQVRFDNKGVSDEYAVHVIPPPTVEQIVYEYEYPEYTGLVKTQIVSQTMLDISALYGTKMTLTATINTPATGFLNLGEWRLPPFRLENHVLQWNATLTTNAAPNYSFELRDARFGHTNDLAQARVRILMDQPPIIEQTSPGAYRFIVHPGMRVPFKFTIHDDYGVESAQLVVRTATRDILDEIPLELIQSGVKKWSTALELPLTTLTIGQTYSIILEATDNCPPEYGGPNISTSNPVTLLVQQAQAGAPGLNAQVIDQQAEIIRKLIEFAASCLDSAATQVGTALPHLDKEELPKEAKDNIETAHLNANRANTTLIEAREVARGTMFRNLPNDIDAVRAQNVRPVAFNTGRILLYDPDSRKEMGAENAAELQNAAAEVRKLLAILQAYVDKAKELLEKIDLLRDLLRQKQDLLKQQMTEEEQDNWKGMQLAAMEKAKEMSLEELLEALQRALDMMDLNTPMDAQLRSELEQYAQAAQLVIDSALDIIETTLISEVIAKGSILNDKAAEPLGNIRDSAQQLRDALQAALAPPEGEDPAEHLKNAATLAASILQTAEAAADTVKSARAEMKTPRYADAAQKAESAILLAQEAAELAINAAKDGLPGPDAATRAEAVKAITEAAQTAEKSVNTAQQSFQGVKNENTRLFRELDFANNKSIRSTRRADDFIRGRPMLPPNLTTANNLLQKAIKGSTDAVGLLKGETKTEPVYRDAIRLALQAREDAEAALKTGEEALEDAREQLQAMQEQQDAAQEMEDMLDQLQQELNDEMNNNDMQMDTPPMEGMDDENDQDRKPHQTGEKRINVNIDEQWFRTRGKVEQDALDQDIQNISPEYRQLVIDYFNELLKEPQ